MSRRARSSPATHKRSQRPLIGGHSEILAAVARSKPHAVVLDAETVPYVDVTAITMLEQLAGDLEGDGIGLAIARDVGGVRDVIRRARGSDVGIPTYPTVQAAVDALSG